jgi:hypothetical protein
MKSTPRSLKGFKRGLNQTFEELRAEQGFKKTIMGLT